MNQSTNPRMFVCLAVVLICLFLGSMVFWPSSGQADGSQTAYQRFWVSEGLPEIDEAELVDPGQPAQDLQQGINVRLLTAHSVTEAGDYYETALLARGWEPQPTRPVSGDNYVAEFRNGHRVIQIMARPAQSSRRATAVQIVYRQQSPASRSGVRQVARYRTEAQQESQIDFE